MSTAQRLLLSGTTAQTVGDIKKFLDEYPDDMVIEFFIGPMTQPLGWASDYVVDGKLCVDIE